MARIKHIAIHSSDPANTAAFYKEVFGLEEVAGPRSGYYLSDGYIDLAILQTNETNVGESPRDETRYCCIDHLGFQLDQMSKKSEDAGAKPTNERIDMIHLTDSDIQAYY